MNIFDKICGKKWCLQ